VGAVCRVRHVLAVLCVPFLALCVVAALPAGFGWDFAMLLRDLLAALAWATPALLCVAVAVLAGGRFKVVELVATFFFFGFGVVCWFAACAETHRPAISSAAASDKTRRMELL